MFCGRHGVADMVGGRCGFFVWPIWFLAVANIVLLWPISLWLILWPIWLHPRSGVSETKEGHHSLFSVSGFWMLKIVLNFIFRSVVNYLCQFFQLGPIFSC